MSNVLCSFSILFTRCIPLIYVAAICGADSSEQERSTKETVLINRNCKT
jgi:hypothetical protein